MTFARVNDVSLKAYGGGQHWDASWRKTPALASAQGICCDLSGAPGNPKPNYYTGAELTFTPLGGSDPLTAPLLAKDGLYHGGDVAPAVKVLHKLLIGALASGVTPATFWVCDYLGFYPLVDMDSTSTQSMVNTLTLPRYTDGKGVQAVLVATNPYIGGATFTINATCHDDVVRDSRVETSNLTTFIGTVVHSGAPTVAAGGPWIQMPTDCHGIKRVNSITFFAPNGGLAALVLVKVLGRVMTNEISAYSEHSFIEQGSRMPRIYDGAYLNMFCVPNGSVAGVPINGMISSVWN